jgi:hypothetical protein
MDEVDALTRHKAVIHQFGIVDPIERWYRILTHALHHLLKGRVLRPLPRLSARPV